MTLLYDDLGGILLSFGFGVGFVWGWGCDGGGLAWFGVT